MSMFLHLPGSTAEYRSVKPMVSRIIAAIITSLLSLTPLRRLPNRCTPCSITPSNTSAAIEGSSLGRLLLLMTLSVIDNCSSKASRSTDSGLASRSGIRASQSISRPRTVANTLTGISDSFSQSSRSLCSQSLDTRPTIARSSSLVATNKL